MGRAFAFLPVAIICVASAACSSSSTNGATTSTTTDAGTDAAPVTTGGTMCTSARAQLLTPIGSVSTGEVTIISDAGGVKKIYVDASAGGLNNEAKNPRVYINLGTGMKVDIDDNAAFTSTDWDLSIKRTVLYSNSGDAGDGAGGAKELSKAFASVTSADAPATIPPESFFDMDCNEKTDPIGGPLSSFSDWYDYDQATNIPTPKPNTTWIVKGGTGTLYKVAILSYEALPDGGAGKTTGFFVIEVAAL